MTKTAARSEGQRSRILAAARDGFVASGFHGASMATIAEKAGMSPGLIYRYFENKNSIILAIIEQQLTLSRKRIRALHTTGNLAKRIVDYFDESEPQDENWMNSALYLEISAWATREPQIAEALRQYDRTVCTELGEWLNRNLADRGHALPDVDVASRAVILLSLIEGLKLRSTREPAIDRAILRRTLDQLLEGLVSSPA